QIHAFQRMNSSKRFFNILYTKDVFCHVISSFFSICRISQGNPTMLYEIFRNRSRQCLRLSGSKVRLQEDICWSLPQAVRFRILRIPDQNLLQSLLPEESDKPRRTSHILPVPDPRDIRRLLFRYVHSLYKHSAFQHLLSKPDLPSPVLLLPVLLPG